MQELAAADLDVRLLLRRLCRSIASEQVIAAHSDPELVIRLQQQLEDTAHSVLLGLHPEAAPLYVPPDERESRVATGIAAAVQQLQHTGYLGLARDVLAATARLKSYCTFRLLGSLTETETGAVAAAPFSEHVPLLGLLLGLSGSRPSLRAQRFTFQADDDMATSMAAPALQFGSGEIAARPVAGATLSTKVFTEAPDPHALSNGSAVVAVLLPEEVGFPTAAFAGSEELQDLGSGLNSHPVWNPTAASSMLPPRSSAWLPVPASLLELQRDSRRGAAPRPLGLPLNLLSMSDEPGSCTLFSSDARAAWDGTSDCWDAASADSVQPQGPGSNAAMASSVAIERPLGPQPGQLWSLQEAELAQQALLALQGVSASLLCLEALLAAPDALPRRSIAGMLQSLVAAGKLRQRLHEFVAAFSGNSGGSGSWPSRLAGSCTPNSGGGGTSDPVQQGFAVAVAEVLQRQSAALQQLEQQQACSWVQMTAVGSSQVRRFHTKAPTLMQVALHSRRLQLQLRSLAELCWCFPASSGSGSGADEDAGPLRVAAEAGAGSLLRQPGQRGTEAGTNIWLWQDGFPGGTQLLDYLYRRINEADDSDSPMLRFLFVQAIQPYLRHMHAWAFTPHPVSREFGTAGDKELLTVDFLPPAERHAGVLVPMDPPSFFQPLHASFMRAGSQLRLLHSLEHQGRRLVLSLCDIAEQELEQRPQQQQGQLANAPSMAVPGPAAAGITTNGAHTSVGFSALAGAAVAGMGTLEADAPLAEPWQPWVSFASNSALPGSGIGATDGSLDLQLSTGSLLQAVQVSQERDTARTAAVDSWLGTLAAQRRLAEHAAFSEQLGRAAAQREIAAERAARQAVALSRQQSAKAALLQEQQAAVAEQRARRASEQAQEEAADRQLQAQAALKQHSTAVAELEVALGRAGVSSTHTLAPAAPPARQKGAAGLEAEIGGAQSGVPAGKQQAHMTNGSNAKNKLGADAKLASAAQHAALPAGLPPLKTRSHQRFQDEQQQQRQQGQQENVVPTIAQGTARTYGTAVCTSDASLRQPLLPGLAGVHLPLPHAPYETSAELQHQMSLSAAGQPEDASDAGEGRLAPLSAVLETSITHSVISQYRAVSRACVRLFLDELKVLNHLEALRRFFFQGAGDWAETLVARLGAHADSLLPLASHQADTMLADSVRGSSVEHDPYAAHLCIKMLPGNTSAIQAQFGAIHSPSPVPQRRAKSFWSSSHTLALAPTQLDVFDCVTLDYHVGWPLSAIITEDTLQGYAAVFSWMVRLRRTEQLLRSTAPPLAAQPKSTADLLLSEEDADKAHRRIQRLRAFRFGAAQFVAALQTFLQARTTGDAWVHLLAKLMVSSEEVAATLISRQPSASMTGLLSRMNSLGPTGKAAHTLAQQLTRALSLKMPGSPTAAAGASGRVASGQLSRFNSLLSAVAGASSSANTPRARPATAAAMPEAAVPAGVRQLSRFANPASTAAPVDRGPFAGPAAQPSISRQPWDASGASSPTAAATAGGDGGAPLSTQVSSMSAMLEQVAEEQAAASSVPALDAAAWAQHFQRSQQGIADLQELLDLHRHYVRHASEDCLTFGGNQAVRDAVEGCLQCLVTFAFKLLGTVRSGAGRRAEETWTQSLRLDASWRPLAAVMADFEARAQQLQELLSDLSSKSVLAELQLDFNNFYLECRQRMRSKASVR